MQAALVLRPSEGYNSWLPWGRTWQLPAWLPPFVCSRLCALSPTPEKSSKQLKRKYVSRETEEYRKIKDGAFRSRQSVIWQDFRGGKRRISPAESRKLDVRRSPFFPPFEGMSIISLFFTFSFPRSLMQHSLFVNELKSPAIFRIAPYCRP